MLQPSIEVHPMEPTTLAHLFHDASIASYSLDSRLAGRVPLIDAVNRLISLPGRSGR